MENLSSYSYEYTFTFKDGRIIFFAIEIDKKTIELIFPKRTTFPEWTLLEYCKCPNCPLTSTTNKQCPMAVSIIDVAEAFKDVYSYEEVEISIKTPERTYYKKGPIQEGLSSIMGLYMPTSGCPNLKKLKPMAANHLPFASLEETMYRIFSMYALAQLFKNRNTLEFDTEFSELKEIYRNISIVNQQFCQRLRHLEQKDANVNAVIILNNFAEFVPFSVNEDMLEEIHCMFNDYLKPT